MTTLMTSTNADTFLGHLEELKRRSAAPGWLAELRERGLAQYRELGLPKPHDEEWRYTRIDAIAKGKFELVGTKPKSILRAERDLKGFTLDTAGPRLVFVDGCLAPALCRLEAGRGVRVSSLAEAIGGEGDFIGQHLGQYIDITADAFGALNLAFLEDGAVVHVSKRTAVEEPIHLLFVSTAGASPAVSHPHNLIVVEEGAKATVIEDYVSLGEDANFTNAVTELVVGDEAEVEHYLLERESARSLNVSTLRVQQGRQSSFSSHSVLLGGALVRNNVHPVLAGEGSWSLLNGLYVIAGTQHVDNHMRVEHAAAHCDSRQFYRGVLADQASAIFSGRIIVHRGAQKTDAKQNSSSLLLSPDAQTNTKPQLEIYADDVKCTHGATVGQIDEEAIFYLRSRGISEASARGLLIHAFAGESLERMKVAAVRELTERQLLTKLPLGDLVGQVL
ncbi:MAG: Fe-S cluster assembly protein SufD [Phycisphaeraceae bacterium]|nr:Fe-S cluster assembly protein SufD [Phycisphaeraceae bacterium]